MNPWVSNSTHLTARLAATRKVRSGRSLQGECPERGSEATSGYWFLTGESFLGDPAQSLVDGDESGEDICFGLSHGFFGLQLRAFGVEQRQEVRHTFPVTNASDIGRAPALARLFEQCNQALLLLAVADQRILDRARPA